VLGEPAAHKRLHRYSAFSMQLTCRPALSNTAVLVRVRHSAQPLCSPWADLLLNSQPPLFLAGGFTGSVTANVKNLHRLR